MKRAHKDFDLPVRLSAERLKFDTFNSGRCKAVYISLLSVFSILCINTPPTTLPFLIAAAGSSAVGGAQSGGGKGYRRVGLPSGHQRRQARGAVGVSPSPARDRGPPDGVAARVKGGSRVTPLRAVREDMI